jgi:glycosyltransferase involved in cell wall biosynthesis
MKLSKPKILFVTTHSIEPYRITPDIFSKYEFHPHRFCRISKEYADPILAYLSLSVKEKMLSVHRFGHPMIAYPVTFNRGRFNYEISRKLHEDITRSDADIIHVHNYYSLTYDLIVLLNITKKPIVGHYHGGDLSMLLRPFRIFKRMTLPLADKLLVINKSEAQRLVTACKVPKEKIAYIHDGVDTNFFKPLSTINKEDNLILFVGNLVKEKGIDLLLSAFKECKRKVKDLKLLIVGEGYMKDYLKRMLKTLDLVNDVKLTGRLSHDDLRVIYNKATITVLPSKREALPIVLLESMACGTPVIATINEGSMEIVSHGYDGLLVKQDDITALSEAICRLISDSSLREEMGKRGREKVVSNFSIMKFGRQLNELYRSLI